MLVLLPLLLLMRLLLLSLLVSDHYDVMIANVYECGDWRKPLWGTWVVFLRRGNTHKARRYLYLLVDREFVWKSFPRDEHLKLTLFRTGTSCF